MIRPHGKRTSRAKWMGFFFCLFAIAIPSGGVGGPDDVPGTSGDVVDCGTMALGTLLLLEGHPIDPKALLSCVGPSPSEGPSMERLRDAARACGLSLRAVRLNKEERAIDRPMLVFLKRQEHGHFQVVRPVGHTGRLAQVIDPNSTLDVVEKLTMLTAPEWTGIALVPDRRPGWPVRISCGLIGGISLAGLGWAGLRSLGRRDGQRADLR